MKHYDDKQTKMIQRIELVNYTKEGSTDGSNTLDNLIKIQQQNKNSKKRKR